MYAIQHTRRKECVSLCLCSLLATLPQWWGCRFASLPYVYPNHLLVFMPFGYFFRVNWSGNMDFECTEPCCNYEHEENEKKKEALEQDQEKKILKHLIDILQRPKSADLPSEFELVDTQQGATNHVSTYKNVDVEIAEKNIDRDSPTGEDTTAEDENRKYFGRDAIWNVYGYGLAFHTTSLVLKPVPYKVDAPQTGLQVSPKNPPNSISLSQHEQIPLNAVYDLLLELSENEEGNESS